MDKEGNEPFVHYIWYLTTQSLTISFLGIDTVYLQPLTFVILMLYYVNAGLSFFPKPVHKDFNAATVCCVALVVRRVFATSRTLIKYVIWGRPHAGGRYV